MNNQITRTELILKKNLIKYRMMHDLSVKKLAELIHIDYAQYHRYENPLFPCRPKWPILERIVDLYGIKIADLFSED